MRISSNQIQQRGIQSILEQQVKLSKTQQQVATGQRVLLPSDDPVATTQMLQLQQTIDNTAQYQANADCANNRLATSEGVMAGITNLLQRVRELAIQGANGTQTNETRGFISAELRQCLEELVGLANTKDGTGDYLFSGTKASTQPFTANSLGGYDYNGDQTTRSLQIGAGRYIADGNTGAEVFQLVRNGNGTFVTEPAGNSGGGANQGTGVIDQGAVNGQFTPSLPNGYTINFTTSFTITDSTGNPVTPADGDTFTTAEGNTISFSQPLPTDPISYQIKDTSGNTIIPAGGEIFSVTDGSANFTIQFEATYGVTDSTGGVIIAAGTPYIENQPIQFYGAVVSVRGTPANGDTFSVRSSENQDIFQTVKNLADALDSPSTNSVQKAALANQVNRSLADIDQAIGNILVIRSSIGSRLNAIDSQKYVNDGYLEQGKEVLSSIKDLDYAEAVSRLNIQSVGLQAAQQAYLRINSLSMFNYLS